MQHKVIFRLLLTVSAIFVLLASQSVWAGEIVAWGDNGDGSCDVPPGNDYVAIAAAHHSLALKADGSVVAWGYNGSGQCDILAGNDYIAISASNGYSLALKSDHSIIGWGTGWGVVEQIPLGNNFVAIAAGGPQSLALKSDGSLVSWGAIEYVPEGNDFVAIDSGSYHNLALKSSGSVIRWRGDSVETLDGNYVAISAGEYYDIAIRDNGSVVHWSTGAGIVFDEEEYIGIAAGDYYWVGLKSDGSLVSYGGSSAPEGNNYTAVAFGVFHGLALTADSASISLLNPNGGETLTVSDTFPIEWSSTGTINDVLIELSVDSGATWETIKASTPNTGVYDWLVPETISNECMIQISDVADGTVNDVSDGVFSIMEASSILGVELLVNGGAETGDTMGWFTDGVIVATSGIPGLPDPVDGNFFYSGLAYLPYAYQDVDVSQLASEIDSGIIDSAFNIYLASPAMDPVSVTLSFIDDSQSVLQEITLGPPPLDNEWHLYSDNRIVPVGTRTIRIWLDFWTAGGVVAEGCADEASLILTGETQTQSISILQPNGGEIIEADTVYLIKWESSDNITEIVIEYSIDNGTTWFGVEPPNTGNTGSYEWLVPIANSNECLVRISSADDVSVFDISNAVFTIEQPKVIIETDIDIKPSTLNLNSKGQWITCHIWLPDDYNAEDMDSQSLLLQDTVSPDWIWFDDSIKNVVKAKFSREAIEEILTQGDVELTVTGEFANGDGFIGSDIIKVIDNEKALFVVMQAGCNGFPEMDFSEDCIVNLVDYAMFAAHWLECNREPQEACWE